MNDGQQEKRLHGNYMINVFNSSKKINEIEALDRLFKWILTIGISISPLIYVPFFYDAISLPKAIFVYFLTLLLIIVFSSKSIKQGSINLNITSFIIPLIGYLVVSTVSVAFSAHPIISIVGRFVRWETLPLLCCYFLIFMFASHVYADLFWQRRLIYSLTISLLIASIIGIAQGVGVIDSVFVDNGQPRSYLPLSNPVTLGGFISTVLPLLFGYYLLDVFALTKKFNGSDKKLITKVNSFVVIMIVLPLALACAYYTNTRGALIAILFSLLFIALSLTRLRFNNIWKTSLVLIFVLVASLILLLASIYFSDGSNKSDSLKHFSTRALSTFNLDDPSIVSRLEIWKTSLKMIKEEPILGYGIDQISDFSPHYKTLKLSRLSNREVIDQIHNEFLHIATSAGILGLFFFLWLILGIFLKTATMSIKDKDNYFLFSLPFAASILGYAIQSISGISVVDFAAVFWGILGAASSFAKHINLKFMLSKNSSYFLIVTVIVLCIAVISITYQPALASYYMGLSDNIEDQSIDDSISYAEKAVELRPFAYYYRSKLVLKYINKAYKDRDEAALVIATQVLEDGLKLNDEDYDNLFELAETKYYYAQFIKDKHILSDVISDYKKAIEKYPYAIAPRQGLVNCYLVLENYKAALKMGKEILAIDPMNTSGLISLGRTYELIGDKRDAKKYYSMALEIEPNLSVAKEGLKRIKK